MSKEFREAEVYLKTLPKEMSREEIAEAARKLHDILFPDVKLFSPPPVVGDLREKIAEILYGKPVPKEVDWEEYDSYSDWKRKIQYTYDKADSILAILADSKQRYVKLGKGESVCFYCASCERMMLVKNRSKSHQECCDECYQETLPRARLGENMNEPTPAPESRPLKVKQQYVIGFLFNYTAETVLLIQKNRPDWQKGKLNGVGGHVEHGEKPVDAMKREFYEEAGLQLEWDFFCTMVFPECEVHCFRHIDKSGHIIEVEQKTDEFVDWYNYNQVPYNVIPNLHWLIPMALQKEEYMTEVITDAKTSALVRAECQDKIENILLNKSLTMGRKLMAITDVIVNLKASPNNI